MSSSSSSSSSEKQWSDIQQELRSVHGFSDFQKINDYLYIGNQVSAMQKSRLKQEGITHVLKVNGLENRLPSSILGAEYKIVALEDNEYFEITDQDLEECFSFIRPKGRKTIVVCTAGISRSSTICIAYLMRYENLSLAQAHA